MESKVISHSMYDATIYIIDNDREYTDKIKHFLRESGFQDVVIFHSAKEGLEQLLRYKKKESLVITELYFQKTTGDFVIKQLKDKYEDIKILVLSGTKKMSDALKCVGKFKASSFMRKGVDDNKEHIIEIIREQLKSYHSVSDLIKVTFEDVKV